MSGYSAAVSWFDGAPHLRVYRSNGTTVTETCWEGGWTPGAFRQEGTTVGATSWVDAAGQIHIRLYVGSWRDDAITEWCWDADRWYKGAFAARGLEASPTCWMSGGQPRLRVYVRGADNRLTEWCWDTDRWYEGGYPG